MPKIAVDFQKTVIYKIVCKDLTVAFAYVGMTTDFIKRKSCHKNKCDNKNNKKYNLKVYKIIRENGGWINWTMLQIEAYPCNTSVEARAKEREWYEKLNSEMNNNIPLRTEEERKKQVKDYQENNKAQIAEQRKTYMALNKAKIASYQKEYKVLNKDKLAEQAKTYYEKNKEKILNYQNEYNENHKEEIIKQKKAYYEKNKNKV
jgi:hypothetical protein